MKLKKLYYRIKAKYALLSKYEYLNEVNSILEEYETNRILVGGSQDYLAKCRSALVNKQNEINENSKFIEYLKKR